MGHDRGFFLCLTEIRHSSTSLNAPPSALRSARRALFPAADARRWPSLYCDVQRVMAMRCEQKIEMQTLFTGS